MLTRNRLPAILRYRGASLILSAILGSGHELQVTLWAARSSTVPCRGVSLIRKCPPSYDREDRVPSSAILRCADNTFHFE